MKKILITRKLLKSNEDRASKIFDAKLNSKDEIYSQKKIIELSKGCDGILSSGVFRSLIRLIYTQRLEKR